MDHPLPTHLIGTPAFFPTLLAHIRNAAPNPALLPLDKLLLQSILICLVAGNKHLILTTAEEDIPLLVKLAVWTLQSLFSLRTSKLKIRPRHPSSQLALNTDTFLRTLFHPSSVAGGESSQDESRHGHAREPSWGSSSKRKKRAKSKSKSRSNLRSREDDFVSHHRAPSGSSPRPVGLGLANAPTSAPDALEHPLRPTHQHAETDHGYFSPPPVPDSPKTAKSKLHHAYTDPLPMPVPRRFSRKSQGKQREEEPDVPQALVISGLENASLSSQRALSAVLNEGKVVFESEDGVEEVIKLPETFLLVYVCRWDPKERVGLEKTLLDKFTFSTPISISQGIRNTVHAMPFSSPTLGVPTNHLVHPKPNRAFSFSYSHSNPSSPSPTHTVLPPNRTPPPRPASPRKLSHHHHHHRHSSLPQLLPPNLIPPSFLALLRTAHENAYFPPRLDLYLTDLVSAIRHWHELDGTLITARARKGAEDVARAWRVLGMDFTGMELVGGYSEEESLSSEEGWEVEVEQEDVPGITIDMRSVSLRSRSMHTAREGDEVPVLSVTEGDVGRTIARVVTHRLRVREMREEVLASVLFGATFDEEEVGERRTVKEILVEILGEV